MQIMGSDLRVDLEKKKEAKTTQSHVLDLIVDLRVFGFRHSAEEG